MIEIKLHLRGNKGVAECFAGEASYATEERTQALALSELLKKLSKIKPLQGQMWASECGLTGIIGPKARRSRLESMPSFELLGGKMHTEKPS